MTVPPRNRRPLLALFGANIVSLTGNELTLVAVPWFVLQTTGSPTKTGLTALAATLPTIFAGLFGGPFVDRLGYKRASVLTDLASSLTVALIPLLYHTVGLGLFPLLILVFLRFLLNTPGGTARNSLRPDLADLADFRLDRVNGISEAVQNFSMLAGPSLGGLLIVTIGTSNVLWFDAASFVVSAGLVAFAVPEARTSRNIEMRAYRTEFAEGWQFIRRHRLLRAVVIIAVISNLLGAPFFSVVMPVYVRRTFGSAVDLGLMVTAFSGGALVGSVLFSAVCRRLPRRATLTASVLGAALPLLVLALLPPLGIILSLLVLRGAAFAPINTILATVGQERTPTGLRGRVFGMMSALGWVSIPLGSALAGYALGAIGIRPILVATAILYLLVAMYIGANPVFADMDSIRASSSA